MSNYILIPEGMIMIDLKPSQTNNETAQDANILLVVVETVKEFEDRTMCAFTIQASFNGGSDYIGTFTHWRDENLINHLEFASRYVHVNGKRFDLKLLVNQLYTGDPNYLRVKYTDQQSKCVVQ